MFAPQPKPGEQRPADAEEKQRAVRQRAIDTADALQARARREVAELPFTS